VGRCFTLPSVADADRSPKRNVGAPWREARFPAKTVDAVGATEMVNCLECLFDPVFEARRRATLGSNFARLTSIVRSFPDLELITPLEVPGRAHGGVVTGRAAMSVGRGLSMHLNEAGFVHTFIEGMDDSAYLRLSCPVVEMSVEIAESLKRAFEEALT